MSGINDWLGEPEAPKPEPEPASPMAAYEAQLKRIPQRPRIVDPATVKHMDGRAVAMKLRTVHGRMHLHGDLMHPEQNACPGCMQSIAEALEHPVLGSEMN